MTSRATKEARIGSDIIDVQSVDISPSKNANTDFSAENHIKSPTNPAENSHKELESQIQTKQEETESDNILKLRTRSRTKERP